ncbi:MAG TPA: hypothetical protein VGB37_16390 [Candidatus Lokiarchaeia archaeon]
MNLIKLNRPTKDIGIFGSKGSFKTTVAVLIAYLENTFYGTTIFSNIEDLNFPHIYVKTIKEAKEMITGENRKLFVGDDFERWFYSRNWKKNLELTDVLLDWGKYYTSIIYNGKRMGSIDIGLIEGTTEFWYNEPKLYIRSNTGNSKTDEFNNNILKDYANFLYIKILRWNNNFMELPSIRIYNIQEIFKLFSTHEIVKEVS